MKTCGVGFAAARLALMSASASVGSIALAQSYSVPTPPTRLTTDSNGINLASGQFTTAETDLSIGPKGAGGLAHSRFWSQDTTGGGWRHQFLLSISPTANGRSVNLGGSSATFTRSGSTYTSDQGDGSSLTESSAGYTYTARDGTIYTFAVGPVQNDASYYGKVYAVGSTITRPSGEIVTLTYYNDSYEQFICGTLCDTITISIARLQSVTSNTGYQLQYGYATSDSNTTDDWYRITSVKAINRSTDYCAPEAVNCNSVAGSQVTYAQNVVNETLVEQVTDPANRVKSYRTDGNRRMIGIKRATSTNDTYTIGYDGNNRVASFSNGSANWAYNWSLSGATFTGTVTQPLNRQRVVVANSATGNVTSDTDALNRKTSFGYDNFGRLTSMTAPEGNSATFAYDGRGNMTTQTGVAKSGSGLSNITASAVFSSSCSNAKTCNQPNSTTDERGNVTDYSYDANHGGVTSVTAPAAVAGGIRPQTRYAYAPLYAYYKNSSGSVVAAPSPIYMLTSTSSCQTGASCSGTANEVKTTYNYGTPGTANNLLLTSTSAGAGDGSLTATNTLAYGVVGNLKSVDGPLPGIGDTTLYTYTADREVSQVTSPDPDGADPRKSQSVKYGYNADGQVTGILSGYANADGSSFVSTQQSAAAYDTLGRKISESVTGGGGTYSVTQYSYDAANRLDCTAVRMNNGNFGSLPASACTPGTTGSTGPDRLTRYSYNNADEVTTVTASYGLPGQQYNAASYTYSRNGKLKTVADGNGNLTTYVYDGFDRVSQTLYPSPTATGVSSTTDYEQLGYDKASNVVTRRLRNGSQIALAYDNLDRLTAKTLPTGNANLNPSFAYDNLGRLIQANNSSSVYNTATSYAYDALGRVITETSSLNGAARVKSSQYDIAGRRTRLTWNDGFYVTYEYDQAGAMTAIRENGSALLASFEYSDQGQRTKLTRGNGTSTTYGYDPVSRLQSLVLAPSGVGNSYSFTYTPSDQMLAKLSNNDAFAWTRATNADRSYARNGLNQYTSITSPGFADTNPTYDPRGNLTQAGATTYSYSAENELALAGTSSRFYYDPLHRLVFSTATNTRFENDGDAMIAEYNNSGGVVRRYVFGPGVDEPLVWYEGAGTGDRRWLAADERGSIVSVTDAAGSNLAINSYDEYGMPGINNLGRFQYTGQMWMPELAMYHYKARVYSPTLGRFLQTDPIGYGDGLNMYDYAHGDPVNGTDPSGLANAVTCPPGSAPNTICATTTLPGNSGSSGSGDGVNFSGAIVGVVKLANQGLCSIGIKLFGGCKAKKSKPQSDEGEDIVVTAQKYGKKALDCAASHYGLNLGVAGAGAGLAAAGANVIETRGKFAGATPGTSWAGRAASAIYGNAKMAFRLPTLTGFPGIGNGLRVSSTLSAAKFAGRAVPVVGYALLAADALAIGYCTVSGGE